MSFSGKRDGLRPTQVGSDRRDDVQTVGKIMSIALLRLCLLSMVMLGGCQGFTLSADTTVLSDVTFGDLWSAYSHCQSSADADEMRQDLLRLSRSVHNMSEAMNSSSFLPQGVQRLIEEPPSRLAVDPRVMVIACALHAGQAAKADGRPHMAAELFGFVLSNDRESRYAYYASQARLGLAQMQASLGIERVEHVIKVSGH
jgi:hypothetical protein